MTKSTDAGKLIIGVFHVGGISLKSIAVLKEFDLRKRLFGPFTGTRKTNEVREFFAVLGFYVTLIGS
jgi:hypothetical protein